MHQLPPDTASSRGMGRGVPEGRADDHRRAQPRVRVRARPRQRPFAVRRLGIRYPVALDNDFATWQAYANQYWPAKYLIDRTGRIRFHHFGEGDYSETEARIRALLGETVEDDRRRPFATRSERDPDTGVVSRLPAARAAREPGHRAGRGSRLLVPAFAQPADSLAYAGHWTVESERILAGRSARLRLEFGANDIFLVLAGRGRVRVSVDGRARRVLRVSGHPRLYTVDRFDEYERGLLELRFSPGVAAYAFTFG